MSIFPQEFEKGHAEAVLLHMRTSNGNDREITGKCVFEIEAPDGTRTVFQERVTIPPTTTNDIYRSFSPLEFQVGRYEVEGYFQVDSHRIESATKEDDYFIVNP